MSFLMRRGILSSADIAGEAGSITGDMLQYSTTKRGSVSSIPLRLVGSTTMTIAFKVDLNAIVVDSAVMGTWDGNGWMAYTGNEDLAFFTNSDFIAWDHGGSTSIVSVVMMMNGSTKEMWVDGSLVASATNGSSISSSGFDIQFNWYLDTPAQAGIMAACGYQIFNVAKNPPDLFDMGGNLIYDTTSSGLVFAMSGLSGHDPFIDVIGAETFTTFGGLSADGLETTLTT